MNSDEMACRMAYRAAGWTCYWPYEQMPVWLRPAWHHDFLGTPGFLGPETAKETA